MTFPVRVLDGAETAACFFCAGFLGVNAERYVRDAGLTAYCVDTDAAKVAEMQASYPQTWEFVVADAYEQMYAVGGPFDVVTADPPLGEMRRCFEHLPRLREIGKRVVLGISPDLIAEAKAAGATELICRVNSGASWWAIWT